MGKVNVLRCYDYMTKLFVIFALLSGRNCEVDEINKPCFFSYIVLLQVLCCADNLSEPWRSSPPRSQVSESETALGGGQCC